MAGKEGRVGGVPTDATRLERAWRHGRSEVVLGLCSSRRLRPARWRGTLPKW
jgi:hypothetical protein